MSFQKGHIPKAPFKKGNIPWNKGKKLSEKTRKKMSESHKGKHFSPKTEFKKGQKFSEKTRKKMSEARKGIKLSEKTREKIRKANIGRVRPEVAGENSPMRRPEVRAKLRVKNLGNKNPAWLGGLTSNPYGLEFNEELKLQIRRRDNYICQECKQTEKQLKYKLAIHHIDYNKQNNNPNNLISLCRSCHSQTNFKREDWINYFKEKIWEH